MIARIKAATHLKGGIAAEVTGADHRIPRGDAASLTGRVFVNPAAFHGFPGEHIDPASGIGRLIMGQLALEQEAVGVAKDAATRNTTVPVDHVESQDAPVEHISTAPPTGNRGQHRFARG